MSPTLSPSQDPPPLASFGRHPSVLMSPLVSPDQVFGCPLPVLCERERGTVPRFVLQCIQTVERRGTTSGTGTPWGHQHGDSSGQRLNMMVGFSLEPQCWLLPALPRPYWLLSHDDSSV